MQKVNLRNLHIKWNLDSLNKNCILIVTEPTTPLFFMRNSVGLFLKIFNKYGTKTVKTIEDVIGLIGG